MTEPFDLRLWLSSLDPTLLHFVTFFLMLLEGAGVPGVPGALPMIAQVAEIDAGHTTLAAAIFWGHGFRIRSLRARSRRTSRHRWGSNSRRSRRLGIGGRLWPCR